MTIDEKKDVLRQTMEHRDAVTKPAQRAFLEMCIQDDRYKDAYGEAALSLAEELGIRIGSSSTLFDPEKHILLPDVAHRRRIDWKTSEYQTYLKRVRNAGIATYMVNVPMWPPTMRTKLMLLMSTSGGQAQSGWESEPWVGEYTACDRNSHNERETFRIAKKMVPEADLFDAKRMAYQWRVPEYQFGNHVPVAEWCEQNSVDMGEFLNHVAKDLGVRCFEVTNPKAAQQEAETGQWNPLMWAFDAVDLPVVQKHYGLREMHIPDRPRTQEVKHKPTLRIPEGAVSFAPGVVLDALEKALGRECRLFSGRTTDSAVVGMPKDEFFHFMKQDPTDKLTYVWDNEGLNFDCEDFSMALRQALMRKHGLNSIGVVSSDRHAFCFAVLVGPGMQPEIVFVEPQDDQVVESLTGSYSVRERCEVYL